MAVQWGLQGPGFNALESLQAFGQAQQQGLQRQQLTMKAQEQQQILAARQAASQQLGQGNYQGAAQTAAAGGDFDYAGFASKAAEIGHEQAAQQIKDLGEIALLADTPEKWDAYAQQYVQQGHPEAAKFIGQFSPAARASIISQAGKASEYLKQQQVDYKVVPPGGYLQGFNSQGVPLGGAQTTPPVQATTAAAPQAAGNLEAQAAQAIAAGADPSAVYARLRQMQGGAGSQAPQTFP
jgi:hypothetical protein